MSQPSFISAEHRGTVPHIASRMKAVLANGELSDIEFAVGREHGDLKMFPAHKFALSISSDVFYTMFHGSLAKRDATIIPVPEILPEAFAIMLSYIYTDSVENLKPENVIHTLYCADKYDLPWLADRCMGFVFEQVKPHNCLMLLENALRWTPDCEQIVEKCLDVVDEFSMTVFQSDGFTEIGMKTLEMILQRDTLSAEENVIYTAVEKWAIAACTQKHLPPSAANLRKVLADAVFLIRFPLLTDKQLAIGPAKNGMLDSEEVSKIYVYKHSDIKEPLKFSTEPRKYLTYGFCVSQTSSGVHPFTDKPYKPKEQIVLACKSGYWHPAKVCGDNLVDPHPPLVLKLDPPSAASLVAPTQVVRAADILQRGQLVYVYIDGAFMEAKYGQQRAGLHTVSVAGREYSVDFMQLKFSGKQMDQWKADQK